MRSREIHAKNQRSIRINSSFLYLISGTQPFLVFSNNAILGHLLSGGFSHVVVEADLARALVRRNSTDFDGFR